MGDEVGYQVSRHKIMWQLRWISFMHSEHRCGARRRVWRTLASLVTRGLQPWSSKFLGGVRKTVDLPGLVAVPCVVCELYVVFGVPTQRERGILTACLHFLPQVLLLFTNKGSDWLHRHFLCMTNQNLIIEISWELHQPTIIIGNEFWYLGDFNWNLWTPPPP